MHNFLFKVLEDFWALVIRDSFKIMLISFFIYFYTGFISLTVMVGMEVAVQHNGRKESKDPCQTFPSGDCLWLSVLVHNCFIKVRSLRNIYISDTLDA